MNPQVTAVPLKSGSDPLPSHAVPLSRLVPDLAGHDRVSLGSSLKPRLRFDELMLLTGLKKSTLRAIQNPKAAQYDPTFPPCFRLTARTMVWDTLSVLKWMESKQVIHAASSPQATNSAQEG